MEWRTASERMPELYPVNDSSEKHYKLDGYKVDGFFLHSQCFEYFDNSIAGYKQLELPEFNRVEWLDETLSHTPDKEGEGVETDNIVEQDETELMMWNEVFTEFLNSGDTYSYDKAGTILKLKQKGYSICKNV